jgi:hypothetical protein
LAVGRAAGIGLDGSIDCPHREQAQASAAGGEECELVRGGSCRAAALHSPSTRSDKTDLMSTDNPANAASSSPVPPIVLAGSAPPVGVPAAPPPESRSDLGEQTPSAIYLVSYPKIVFLYPTYIASMLSWLFMLSWGDASKDDSLGPHVVSLLFLMLMALNLVVISFDFPRTTSLTLFFAFSAVGMGLTLLFTFHPGLVPFVTDFFKALKPRANAQFYLLFFLLLSALYVVVWVMARFDYWEVRPNELMHHHGFLSDLERFSAPNLRISKEINDVFEYMLLRSGRLILHPTNEPRAFVLENVFNINRKEAQITKMLGALQVQVRTEAQGSANG